jgi:hypothetical protein
MLDINLPLWQPKGDTLELADFGWVPPPRRPALWFVDLVTRRKSKE